MSKSTAYTQDLRKETIMGTKSNGSQQTTPKRVMSPLKRFNRVAPSPVKPPTSGAAPSVAPTRLIKAAAAIDQPSSLQSSSASLLEEMKVQPDATEESEEIKRPGSAPLEMVGGDERDKKQKNVYVAMPITLEPVIVVKSKSGDLVVQDSEKQNKNGK